MSSFLTVALLTALTLPAHQAPGRQDDFAQAAARHGVPQSLLLALSYLESRWDANAGQPSTAGGYGPMHLLGPTRALAENPAETPAEGPAEGGTGNPAEDPRGDDTRPMTQEPDRTDESAGATLEEAARLTGLSPGRLREDPSANIEGGAAVLAAYGNGPEESWDDPVTWYDAVTRYGGSSAFADEVFEVLRSGAARVTDDGQAVALAAAPRLATPPARTPARAARSSAERSPAERSSAERSRTAKPAVECPAALACEWMPAAYARYGKKKQKYGNHDRTGGRRRVDYIVIHDTEGSYQGIPTMVRDPRYVSWHYSIRSRDGHVAQHVPTRDIAWHSGNWDVNVRSIGIEHEGYLAKGATWFTEAMYRSSARLVRYLAARYDIPLNRARILGHDNVPGTTPKSLAAMHEDPGPFWDWERYFALLRRPIKGSGKGSSVIIRPAYASNAQAFTGCAKRKPCPELGSSTVWLRTAPKPDAPLIDDIGKGGAVSTYSVYDHSARASAGQRFAVAEKRRNWTAIWYLGKKAWFRDPAARPTAVRTGGRLVAPRRDRVPVFGRAYPEKAAYPASIRYQRHVALPYVLRLGQAYSLGLRLRGGFYAASTFDPGQHVLVRGKIRYFQIQLGHRMVFVKARDVRVIH